jgi:hypothetical protein
VADPRPFSLFRVPDPVETGKTFIAGADNSVYEQNNRRTTRTLEENNRRTTRTLEENNRRTTSAAFQKSQIAAKTALANLEERTNANANVDLRNKANLMIQLLKRLDPQSEAFKRILFETDNLLSPPTGSPADTTTGLSKDARNVVDQLTGVLKK